MKLRIAFTVCILATALVAVPAFADDASANAQKEQALTKLLVDKLGKDAEAIRVTIVGEKTTLTGQVAQRSTQELAEQVALYFGAKKIDNQLSAKNEKGLFSGKTKKEMDDSKLEHAVESKVKAEIGAHYKEISIECTGGICSVRGTLPDQARKDLALKSASGVEGVKKVVDLLRIKG
jgi:osmotically-inducible protein OsmY